MADKPLCTVSQIINDLELRGLSKRDETKLIERIFAASDWIETNRDPQLGAFIPTLQARTVDGHGGNVLFVDPILSITSIVITSQGLTLSPTTDYDLYPNNRMWPNGPYTRIQLKQYPATVARFSTYTSDIVITAMWGKYLESYALGATVQNTTSISASGTSLKVNNGALVSPGHVLLIESEMLSVIATEAKIAASSVLTGALTDTSTTLSVTTPAEFNIGEVIRIDSEDMLIVDISATLEVERGWNATTVVLHTLSTAISVQRTYTVKRGINGTTAAIHLNAVAISQYKAPGDVNYLARQITSLMQNKAKSAFAGKSGSAELGTIFYNDEFPKYPILNVSKNYRITDL